MEINVAVEKNVKKLARIYDAGYSYRVDLKNEGKVWPNSESQQGFPHLACYANNETALDAAIAYVKKLGYDYFVDKDSQN